MRIIDLQDKQGGVDISLKIIWDQAKPEERFGKKIKSVLVADAESKQGDPTAYLDLTNEDIEKYKQFDKIKVTNAYTKLRHNGQFWITNAEQIEKIEEE